MNVDEEPDDGPDICCPTVDRIDDLKTSGGGRVFDVHPHKGLLRGFLVEGERNRLMFWYRNGRLTRAQETTLDLRRTR